MLTFGVCYFFDALFVRVWKLDKNLTNVVRMLTLIMMVQCLNGAGTRVEAFYWYSGAVNYTFTFGMAFLWVGLLLRTVYDADEKSRKRKFFWSCFWGFFMGGANYLSALELGIISFLLIIILIMVKMGRFKLEGTDDFGKRIAGFMWIPAVFNLIGFSFSCFGPGNSNRFAETTQMSPVKAVFISLYNTFDMLINDMTRWEMILIFVMLIPIFWKMAEGMKTRLEHPVLFTLFAYLLVSSNMTPPIFATANIDAGRLRALAFMEYVFMMTMVVFYLTVVARQHFGTRNDEGTDNTLLSSVASMIIVYALAGLVIGSALCVIPEHGYYSCTSALFDIVSGDASIYKKENEERLNVLRDSSVTNAGLTEHSVHPEMLFYMDITPDSSEWINQATATYYDKDEVVLLPKE